MSHDDGEPGSIPSVLAHFDEFVSCREKIKIHNECRHGKPAAEAALDHRALGGFLAQSYFKDQSYLDTLSQKISSISESSPRLFREIIQNQIAITEPILHIALTWPWLRRFSIAHCVHATHSSHHVLSQLRFSTSAIASMASA
jgi:hypothetical protein